MNEKIVFGTDGIRGHADQYPFTTEALQRLAYSIGTWATKKYGSQRPKVLIGNDTRGSCPRIKQSLIDGLRHFPFTVVDGGILPTPAVYQLIRSDESYDFGIVISASHNPYYDNGIKLFDAKYCKLNSSDEKTIMEYCNNVPENQHDNSSARAEVVTWGQAAHVYEQNMLALFPEDFLKGVKIVLDCAHGATYKVAPEIMRSLGAEVITIAADPDGKNINEHCGALHPESLQKAVVEHQADVGFAFDGDGDRIVAVSKSGVIKDGDDILALLVALPMYEHVDTIVGTVMTNSGFESTLGKQGKKLIRTPVGDKYVVAAMDENNLPLGGEASGHIIMKNYLSTGDGIFVALKVIESVILNNNWELATFKKFPQVLLNVPVLNKKDLSQAPYDTIIMQHKAVIQDGRILVRYSGTENVLRVMTEASSYDDAHAVAQSLANTLKQSLKS